MIIGIDLGYSHVKGCVNGHKFIFPSAVGSPESAAFSLDSDSRIALQTDSGLVQIGQAVLDQSRFVSRPEDRGWIASDEYKWLFCAALSEATTTFWADSVMIVTGLPIAYYREDKDRLRNVMLGEHTVQREGRKQQRFKVTEVRVIPQPFGSLFSASLGSDGQVVAPDMLNGRVGIIDVGGHTTNLLSTLRARDIERQTGSVDMGAWDVVRALREHLDEITPGLEISDYDIVEAVKRGYVWYYGEQVDISDQAEVSLSHFRRQVLAEASHLWDNGSQLQAILVSGGGAHLIGNAILAHFSLHKNVRVVDDPVFANAMGYVRFGRYLEVNR